MFLKELSIISFKNVEQQTVRFHSRINCFVGGNGAGKTNLLDAIHYLSMGRSAFLSSDTHSIRHGDDFFVLDGEYLSARNKRETVVCSYKRGSNKSLKRNAKEYEKLSDHLGLIPVVIISPADSSLITEAAEERRRYINSFLSQLDKQYLAAIIRYNQVLLERNKLLKDQRLGAMEQVMEILDMQLVESGEIVHRKRAELIERIAPLVEEYYRRLSDDREQVEISYSSALNDASFAELLRESAERDRILQHTSTGIHRDDMRIKISGHQLRRYGSQGQQKSFLIALKLAQYNVVAEQGGEKPLLLLDDLFDRLDLQRVEKLLRIVEQEEFGQIFITDCNDLRLEGILKQSSESFSLFNVENGRVEKV